VARQKDLTPLLARRSRRTELLGALGLARQAVAGAQAELAALTDAAPPEAHQRALVVVAERRSTLAGIYSALAGLVWSAPYRAACEDAAAALQECSAETLVIIAAQTSVARVADAGSAVAR
jgi:hypothetical protein